MVYALGCVLYEMLTGDPPYQGSTAQAVLAKILTDPTPAPTRVRVSIPPNVDAAIRKALEKLPADRFASAQEFARALGDPGFRHGELAATGVAVDRASWSPLQLAVAGLAVVFGLGFAWSLLRPQQPTQVGRFELTFSDGQELVTGSGINIALSPEGSRLVYTGQDQLWQRRLNQLEPEPIPGTEEARNAVFSPDGNSLAFNGPGSLKTVSLLGGPTLTVVASGVPSGAGGLDWGSDGMLYFTNNDGAIQRVPASGGEPTPVTTNEAGTRHQFVAALPESKGLLFTIRRGGPQQSEIAVMRFEDGEVRTLFPGAMARYATSGHLVYAAANGTLLGTPFDLERLEVTGPSVALLEGVSVGGNSPSRFALSETGTLLYVESGGVEGGQQRLLVADLEGNEEALPPDPRPIQRVSWSPDGQSVAYSLNQSTTQPHDLYTYNVTLGTTPRQLTFEGANQWGVFSPDGTRIAFASGREGTDSYDLFVKNLDDDSPARSLITLDGAQEPTQWPSDTLIVFESGLGSPAARDLWTLNLSDPDNPRAEPYLSSEAGLSSIKVSGDGTLAAYHSNESGAIEVYIRSFPDPGERTPVSQGGGVAPSWSPDGNTVYHWRNESPGVWTFMAARIQRQPTPVVLSRDSLFTREAVVTSGGNVVAYDLNAEGDRLIVAQTATGTNAAEIAAEPNRLILVQNFFEELRQVVPE